MPGQKESDFDFKKSVFAKAQQDNRGSQPTNRDLLEAAEEVTETLLSNHYNNIIQEIAGIVDELDEMKQEDDTDTDTIEAVQIKLENYIEETYGVEDDGEP